MLFPQLIAELAAAVGDLLQAGANAIPREGRFHRLSETLKLMARQVPALAPLVSDCERVQASGPDSTLALLDLVLRLRQVRAGLATTETPDGELAPLPRSGPWLTPLPVEEAIALADLLPAGTPKGWKTLNRTIESSGLDLRLAELALEAALHQADRSGSVSKKQPAWLLLLVEELASGLNRHGAQEDARRLQLLTWVAPEVGWRLCRLAVRDASDTVRYAALELLQEASDLEELLPELLGLLESKHHGIWGQARSLLVRIGLPAVPALVEMLQDTNGQRSLSGGWTLAGMLNEMEGVQLAAVTSQLRPEAPRLRQLLRRAPDANQAYLRKAIQRLEQPRAK